MVSPLPQSDRSEGGVLFDMSRRDDRKQFKVLQVGPGKRLKNGSIQPLEIVPGDKVLIGVTGANLFEWTDGVMIIDASEVVAFWK